MFPLPNTRGDALMKKSNQSKIAIFSILLFSKTVFASDLLPYKPELSPFPKDNIVFKPSSAIKKKLPGIYSSPQTEIVNKNFKNAKVSCIQDAMDAGVFIPNVSEDSAWEFASKTSSPSNILGRFKSKVPSNIVNQLTYSGSKPAAVSFSACGDNLRRTSCVALLNKAMNESSQAAYKSELKANPEVWDEVLAYFGFMPETNDKGEHKDLITALKDVETKQTQGSSSTGTGSANFAQVENEDPLLLATKLIIQRIDEALARGDDKAVAKAKTLLKKINPSAEYAASCVLGYLKSGGLNEDLYAGGMPFGSYIGPLSGVDYGALDKARQLSLGASDIIAIIALGVAVVGVISSYFSSNDSSEDTREATSEAKKARIDGEIAAYEACPHGKACDYLYPDAVAALKEAKGKAAKNEGTAGPAVKVENPDLFAPMPPIKQPGTGSGGAGGELAPFDPTASVVSELKQKSAKQHDWDKVVDPSASERFCESVIRGYKKFVTEKISKAGKPFVFGELNQNLPIVNKASFSPTQFDQWNASFWTDKKNELRNNPDYIKSQNNCHVMDEVGS